ncbi:MAG TPA: platelet-activating factor acetylhydrolase IB subunit, partial [Pirellulales bacterium]|nr:platelet-activating factor acetylhydrolase IB subunit [Pirellulales bacterium]
TIVPSAKAFAEPDTVKPVPREGKWAARQDSINARAKEGQVDLIMIGDSITQGWEAGGQEAWKKYYGSRHAMNAGISGDRTQHVLWRLEHGNVDKLSPKLAVVMIGTNNAKDNEPQDTAAGITAIVHKLREKLPQTKILLLAIFPRGETPNDPLRQKNEEVNKIIKHLDDGSMVRYLDIGNKFLDSSGTLSREIMPDLLHLTPKGYEIWASAIEPQVSEVLGPR